MNKRVFPSEQRSQLALGTSLVQQQELYVASVATHGLLYPVGPQANSLQWLTLEVRFQT